MNILYSLFPRIGVAEMKIMKGNTTELPYKSKTYTIHGHKRGDQAAT